MIRREERRGEIGRSVAPEGRVESMEKLAKASARVKLRGQRIAGAGGCGLYFHLSVQWAGMRVYLPWASLRPGVQPSGLARSVTCLRPCPSRILGKSFARQSTSSRKLPRHRMLRRLSVQVRSRCARVARTGGVSFRQRVAVWRAVSFTFSKGAVSTVCLAALTLQANVFIILSLKAELRHLHGGATVNSKMF